MRGVRDLLVLAVCGLVMGSGAGWAQEASAGGVPQADSSYIDADGTAHITRVIPVPLDLSPEAKKSLSRPASDAAHPRKRWEQRRSVHGCLGRAGVSFLEDAVSNHRDGEHNGRGAGAQHDADGGEASGSGADQSAWRRV